MKFQNEKNKLITLLLLGVCFTVLAFSRYSKSKYAGTYYYHSVTRNGVNVFQVGINDSLVLNKNHIFLYDIAAPNKHMRGTWKIIKTVKDSSAIREALEFTYAPDGNKRVFYLCRNKQFSLCLREGNIYFNFK